MCVKPLSLSIDVLLQGWGGVVMGRVAGDVYDATILRVSATCGIYGELDRMKMQEWCIQAAEYVQPFSLSNAVEIKHIPHNALHIDETMNV